MSGKLDLGQPSVALCECGHPLSGHEIVQGVEFEDNGYIVTDEDGTRLYGIPTVWICTTPALEIDDEDISPWDCVCGCVLHHDPEEG